MFGNYIRSMPSLGGNGSSARRPGQGLSGPKHSRSAVGSGKADASTRCQRCEGYGHFTYNCTSKSAPYKARPTRTQMLKNPQKAKRVEPSVEVPEEFLSKKGVAAKVLERNEQERKALDAAKKDNKRSKRSSSSGSSDSDSDSSDSDSDGSVSSDSDSDSSSNSRSSRSDSRSRSRSRPRRSHRKDNSRLSCSRSRSRSPSATRSPPRRRRRTPSVSRSRSRSRSLSSARRYSKSPSPNLRRGDIKAGKRRARNEDSGDEYERRGRRRYE